MQNLDRADANTIFVGSLFFMKQLTFGRSSIKIPEQNSEGIGLIESQIGNSLLDINVCADLYGHCHLLRCLPSASLLYHSALSRGLAIALTTSPFMTGSM